MKAKPKPEASQAQPSRAEAAAPGLGPPLDPPQEREVRAMHAEPWTHSPGRVGGPLGELKSAHKTMTSRNPVEFLTRGSPRATKVGFEVAS